MIRWDDEMKYEALKGKMKWDELSCDMMGMWWSVCRAKSWLSDSVTLPLSLPLSHTHSLTLSHTSLVSRSVGQSFNCTSGIGLGLGWFYWYLKAKKKHMCSAHTHTLTHTHTRTHSSSVFDLNLIVATVQYKRTYEWMNNTHNTEMKREDKWRE